MNDINSRKQWSTFSLINTNTIKTIWHSEDVNKTLCAIIH